MKSSHYIPAATGLSSTFSLVSGARSLRETQAKSKPADFLRDEVVVRLERGPVLFFMPNALPDGIAVANPVIVARSGAYVESCGRRHH